VKNYRVIVYLQDSGDPQLRSEDEVRDAIESMDLPVGMKMLHYELDVSDQVKP
jgi:hypothetical protein